MRRILPLVLFGLVACGLIPTPQPALTTPTLTPTSPPTASPADVPLGSDKNPLLLALPPSAHIAPEVLDAGNVLSAQLETATGYKVVTVAASSETELVKAFIAGNAHIGVLSPFAYLKSSDQGNVEAALGRERNGDIFYGAQFIVRADAGFTAFYDPLTNENTADAPVALLQFKDKKPCWTDQLSPSGYVVPLGYLGEAGVTTSEPAFLASHPAVVRAVYAKGICDFGATYIDARQYPGLEDQFPDMMKKVVVVWRVPSIIPYETLVFAHGMTVDMRRALIRAFVDLMTTDQGKSVMQTLYGIDAMQVTQDGQYVEFRKVVKASGLDLDSLIK